MSPVLVLQNLSADGPAYLGDWLRRLAVPHVVLNAEAGDTFPDHLQGYSALALLGGEMSANDPLPSLRRAELLILDAMARGCPVIGHCLGGQLMARALGAPVVRSPQPEVGWHRIEVADNAVARSWFEDAPHAHVFQWHEEAFHLPPGATALASNEACPVQAFALGPHLALQFHVELDAEKLQRWAASQSPEFLEAQRRHPTVQNGALQMAGICAYLASQQQLADSLYARWLAARTV